MKEYLEKLHLLLILVFSIPAFMMGWDIDGTPFNEYFEAQTIVYIASLLIFLKWAYIESKTDADKYPSSIDYLASNIFRIMGGIALFFLFNYQYVFGWIYGILLLISIAASFSLVFDLRYNLLRGLKWYYVGETSWMDRNFGRVKQIACPTITLITWYVI